MRTLDMLKIGEKAEVAKILTDGNMRRRFLDIGLVAGTCIECVGISPSGDPKAFLIRGAVIAVRNCDSRSIIVS